MFSWESGDEDYLPISLISHYLFCKRQAGLILLEDFFEDNELTIEGRLAHSSVHTPHREIDGNTIREYSYPVFSEELKIFGFADLVEFTPGLSPYPVEYKLGKYKTYKNLEVHVTAIAICLEEMFNQKIEKGAIFHVKSQKRREFLITEELRQKTKKGFQELRAMQNEGKLSPGIYTKKCRRCSLKDYCLPELFSNPKPNPLIL